MLKTLVRSARMPVNMKLLSETSRWTSLASDSMVPGLERPSWALRSEKELRASPRALASGLLQTSDRTESATVAIVYYGAPREED